MKFPYLKNPNNGRPDVMVTLSVIVTLSATLKFLLEGVSIDVAGKTLQFGHVDALTYGALLTPVLGFHGYMKGKGSAGKIDTQELDNKQCPDNPDGEQ